MFQARNSSHNGVGAKGRRFVPESSSRNSLCSLFRFLVLSYSFLGDVPEHRRAASNRSLQALQARNRKKVSNRVFLGSAEKSPKMPEKFKSTPRSPKICISRLFRVFSGTSLRAPPNRPFLRHFCDFGPSGPGDSCKWRLRPQAMEYAAP